MIVLPPELLPYLVEQCRLAEKARFLLDARCWGETAQRRDVDPGTVDAVLCSIRRDLLRFRSLRGRPG